MKKVGMILVFLSFFFLLECMQIQPLAAQATVEQPRRLWERPGNPFIRQWLLCGQFDAPLAKDDDEAPDFLLEHGGEAVIIPAPGMSHTGPNKQQHAWIAFDSPTDIINVAAALKSQPKGYSVSYAYTTIESTSDVQALLAMGIDDGVILYVNGTKVYTHLVGRVVTPDEDMVAISLKKGSNRLLFKLQNIWGNVALCARLVDPAKLLEHAPELSIVRAADATLAVLQIDDPLLRQVADRPAARVELIAAGGQRIATQTANRGESVRFNVSSLKPGPYEFRCTTVTSDGQQTITYAPYYKGDMAAAALALVKAAAKSPPSDLITPVLAELIRYRLRDKLEGLSEIPADAFAGVHSALMENEEYRLSTLNPAARIRPNGFVRLSWIDPIDDSPQFCRAYLPRNYDPSKKWPLVVNLHGMYGANPRYVGWWSADARHSRIADDHNVILIEPHGRGNTSFRGIGQLDVLRAIREAKATFAVDDDRVLLVGQSMGGWGTWHIGTRYPELFAAIGPIYGGSDPHASMTEDQLRRAGPYIRFFMEANSSLAQAESLLTTPVYTHHGDSDSAVPVELTRYNVRTLQRWGYDIRYWEHPGKGHGGLEAEYETTRWFLPLRRVHPTYVRLRSAELKSAHSHWLTVLQREDPMAFILGEAKITAPNMIRLDTQNALEVVLTPGNLIDSTKPVRVIWNDQPAREVKAREGRIVLRAESYIPGALVKTPAVEGPLDDVMNTPFAIIVGTVSTDSRMKEACRAHAGRLIADWERRQHVKPRTFLDVQLSEADMARYSLVLIGGPEANAVTRKLIDRIPLRIEGERVMIDDKTFDAPNAAVGFVYPNPFNSERYISVYAATAPTAQFYHYDLNLPVDFYIDDGHRGDWTKGVAVERLFIGAGLFDRNWRRSDALTLVGDAKLRSESPIIQPKADAPAR